MNAQVAAILVEILNKYESSDRQPEVIEKIFLLCSEKIMNENYKVNKKYFSSTTTSLCCSIYLSTTIDCARNWCLLYLYCCFVGYETVNSKRTLKFRDY